MDRIPYCKPSITELEKEFASDAVATGWGEHCYDYIVRFEQDFKTHLGSTYAVATSSCTGALHLGMAAMGIGPGDEVILADTNWVATVSPVVHLGATPKFVDVRMDTWCIDPQEVANAITPSTKAIIATHLYGNLADMDELLLLGERHGIPVIEDAAEAIGSIYHGRRAGSIGAFGVFSFHGSKTLTTGEGGMFVTDDAELYETVLTLSNHGRARGETKQFWPATVGYKYKMSNVQAAIGCAQLTRVDELVARKIEILDQYRAALTLPGQLTLNPSQDGCQSGYWMPTVILESSLGLARDRLLDILQERGVDARPFFYPLSATPPFHGNHQTCANSTILAGSGLNLPSFHEMSTDQLERVADAVTNSLA